jgi:hypothetical protein
MSKTRKLKDALYCSVHSLLCHAASQCSLIKFKVRVEQFTWLQPGFRSYFGQNTGVSYEATISQTGPLPYLYSDTALNSVLLLLPKLQDLICSSHTTYWEATGIVSTVVAGIFFYSVNQTLHAAHLVVTHQILYTSAIISGCMPIQKARETINTAILPVGICCSFWGPYPLTGLLLWDLLCVFNGCGYWLNWVKLLNETWKESKLMYETQHTSLRK